MYTAFRRAGRRYTDRMSTASDQQIAAAFWSRAFEQLDARGAPPAIWNAIPEVARHINLRISGDPEVDWIEHTARTHFAGRLPLARILSPGCGAGQLERRLARRGVVAAAYGYDVAPGAIEIARREAADAGLSDLHYDVADLNTLELPPRHFDAVWIELSLHHFAELETTLDRLAASLKPDGLLVFNEYVGPSRFQFGPRQKAVINHCLNLLPERYRQTSSDFVAGEAERASLNRGATWLIRRAFDKVRDGGLIDALRRRLSARRARRAGAGLLKTSVSFPTERDLVAADPTESVRSADIMPVLKARFDIVEYRPWGGTLLQFLLGGITHHFIDEDLEAIRLLRALIDLEWALILAGELESDFAFVVARPRPLPGS